MGLQLVDNTSGHAAPDSGLSNELIYKIAYQQANFEVLLENMSQGVGMFDSETKIVFCNRRFYQIFGISDHDGNGLTNLREVLELRVRTGCYPDMDPCEYVQQCVDTINSQRNQSLIHNLRNGVYIMEKHIPFEGGGWLSSFEDITEIYKLKREIEHLAYHDQLTGLPNRHQLIREFKNIVDANNGLLTLFYLDLDGFKAVNDRHGHLIGDELLGIVAKRLTDCTKKSDIVLRLGGDEFAIICRCGMNREDAANLARRVIDRVEEPFKIKNQNITISVSIGIHCANGEIGDFDQLLTHADTAMYSAKRAGSGKFCFHEV